jgi:hypothetical protein
MGTPPAQLYTLYRMTFRKLRHDDEPENDEQENNE